MVRKTKRWISLTNNLLKASKARQALKGKPFVKPSASSVLCLVCSEGCSEQYIIGGRHRSLATQQKHDGSFLLHDILRIPTEDFEAKYLRLKPFNSSVFLCSSCTQMLHKAEDVSVKIKNLNTQMNMLMARITQKIRTTNLRDGEIGVHEDEFIRLAQDIRRHVCLYPNPERSTIDTTNGGMYLSTSIWTSTSASDGRSNFGELRPSDELAEPEIIFLPSSEVRKRDLFQLDPLQENSHVCKNVLTNQENGLEDTLQAFSMQPYSKKNELDLDIVTPLVDAMNEKQSLAGSSHELKKLQAVRVRMTNIAKIAHAKRLSRQRTPQFACRMCDMVFKKILECKQHRNDTHPGLTVCTAPSATTTSRCNKVFRTADVKQHLKEAHSKYQCPCPGCVSEFSSTLLRDKHIQYRHEEIQLPLPADLNVPNEHLIQPLDKEEIKNLNVIKPVEAQIKKVVLFKCSVCQQDFLDQETLISHFISDHNKNVKVKCYVCSMTFNTVEECGAHISKAHPKERGPSTSGISTDNVTGRDAQVTKNSSKFKCDQCAAVLASKGGLSMHKLNHHARKHKCSNCYLRFTNLATLLHHEKSHRNNKRNIENLNNTAADVITSMFPFPCPEPECSKGFLQENILNCHRVKAHNMPKPTFVCEFCNRLFSSTFKLRRHRMNHTGEKPEVCDTCGMRFKSKSSLIIHIRSKHTNERPYECKICSKRFFSSTKLKRHLEVHSTQRPYLCSTCGKTFKSNNNLYIHMWSHDPDRKTKYSLYMPKPKKHITGISKKNRKTNKIDDVLASTIPDVINDEIIHKNTENENSINEHQVVSPPTVPINDDATDVRIRGPTGILSNEHLDHRTDLEFSTTTTPDALMEANDDKMSFLTL